jgi:hypothetical protein
MGWMLQNSGWACIVVVKIKAIMWRFQLGRKALKTKLKKKKKREKKYTPRSLIPRWQPYEKLDTMMFYRGEKLDLRELYQGKKYVPR